MKKTSWGDRETQFFFNLSPAHILDAVEQSGVKLNGRCIPLNSFENRVYELELDTEDNQLPDERLSTRRVAKFYRPGRWTLQQIQEEHDFLQELADHEVPVVQPLSFPDGKTIHQMDEFGLFYSIFPKVGGRSPEELTQDQRLQLGRLLARIHSIGSSRPSEHRLELTPVSYGLNNLEFLLEEGWIPDNFRTRFESAAREICQIGIERFKGIEMIRLHGDCHLGNLLWNQGQAFFLDFDDMVKGPEIQDIWLLLTERGQQGWQQLEEILLGYEEMRPFPRDTLGLMEILRSLRFIHFSAWFAKRWKDPTFPIAFPHFNTLKYWQDQTLDLEEQLQLIQGQHPQERSF